MVNFYNDYVSCGAEATLSQVAGKWECAAECLSGAPLPAPTPAAPPRQTTWTTSRRWQEPEQWALVGTSMASQGKGQGCVLWVSWQGPSPP